MIDGEFSKPLLSVESIMCVFIKTNRDNQQ